MCVRLTGTLMCVFSVSDTRTSVCVSGTLANVCFMQASGRRLPCGKVPVACLIIAAIKIHASDASVTLKDATGLFSALFNFLLPLT